MLTGRVQLVRESENGVARVLVDILVESREDKGYSSPSVDVIFHKILTAVSFQKQASLVPRWVHVAPLLLILLLLYLDKCCLHQKEEKKLRNQKLKKKSFYNELSNPFTNFSLRQPSFGNHLSTNKSEYSDGMKRIMKRKNNFKQVFTCKTAKKVSLGIIRL